MTAAVGQAGQVPLVPGPTDYYPAIPGPRNALLDALRGTRSIYTQFYDPGGSTYGMPTYPWRACPDGWLTRRQLRAEGLRPGGQLPAGQMIWKHRGRRRVAYLYLRSLALPVRPMTPGMWGAVACALVARSTCPKCGEVKRYCIPTSVGWCNDCDRGQP